MTRIPHYSYQVFWSAEDREYVATCAEIPGLSGLAPTEAGAINELKVAIAAWLEHLESQGMSAPRPVTSSRSRTRERTARRRYT
jgi:predicted RNase H-like HicB family nuclease